MTYKAQLKIEAKIIFEQIFDKECPEILIERYSALHEYYFKNYSDNEKQFAHHLIVKNCDLKACEFYLRNKRPLLSKKISSMVYLSEALNDLHSFFYLQKKSNFILSSVKIFNSIVRSTYLYFKGRFILKKYGYL